MSDIYKVKKLRKKKCQITENGTFEKLHFSIGTHILQSHACKYIVIK